MFELAEIDASKWRRALAVEVRIVTGHPENEIALSLYRSAGFRRTGAFAGVEPVLSLELTEPRHEL